MKPREYRKIKFDSLDGVLDELVRDIPRTTLLENKTAIVTTIGSCFAGNLSAAMRESGYIANHLGLGENQNTPMINAAMIHYIRYGKRSKFFPFIEKMLVGDLEAARISALQSIGQSTIFVLTLGVGFLWANQDGNIVLVPDAKKFSTYKSIFPSVRQQVEQINFIIKGIAEINNNVQIVLTVSPVPLNLTKFDYSPIIADCISKSNLRVAAQEVVETNSNVTYFPSFEFFRWVSGHFPQSFYGDDGKVRHVNKPLTDLVVNKFIEIHGGDRSNGNEQAYGSP